MARRDGLPDDVIAEQHGRVGAREGRFSDEALVEDETQAVHVGLDRRALPLDALRSDVHRGRVELRRVRVLLGITCDTEVADLRGVVRVEEDVGRLQVGVNDPFRVRERESVGDLDRDAHRVAGLQRTGLLDALLHRSARQVLHDDERGIVDLADVVDRDDVRMRKLCERSGFFDEHSAKIPVGRGLGIEDLESNVAVQGLVPGEVNLRRSAHAERLLDLVATL